MKITPPLIPRNDAERNVLVYRGYEERIGQAIYRYTRGASRDMFSAVRAILEAAGYDGANRATIMVRQADPVAIRKLEEIANRLPEDQRRRVLSKLYGEIGNGNLTVRRAIRDVTEFSRYDLADKVYEAGRNGLFEVAKSGMMRSEFLVMKAIGFGWSIDAPGTKRVEAFVKQHWTLKDADGWAHPMTNVVHDEIAQGLLLGESPGKIANRIDNVSNVGMVRAKRLARTTVTDVSNQAHMATYKREGIKQYRYSCTFDERTCPACGALDGKIFNVSDQQPGTNAPYMHPNCRCTTYAVVPDSLRERTAQRFRDKHPDLAGRVDPNETFEEFMERTGRTPADR